MTKKPNNDNYFVYNKSERRAIYVLVGLIMGIVLATTIFTCLNNADTPKDADDFLSEYDTFFDSLSEQTSQVPGNPPQYYAVNDARRVETFTFDPNTADSTEFLRLGLAPWMVRNIYKYRAKGGQYHRPEDFAKTYGLTKGDWDRLRPYIRIADKYKYLADVTPVEIDTLKKRSHKLSEGERIDLNAADTVLLQKVPGIGPYFARRIASYRKQLGGFVALTQLYEIEDLPDSVDRFFFLIPKTTKTIFVNRMSVQELRKHPYLDFYQSKVIVEHRRKNGPIRNLEQLSLYDEFTDADLERIAPYVSFEED